MGCLFTLTNAKQISSPKSQSEKSTNDTLAPLSLITLTHGKSKHTVEIINASILSLDHVGAKCALTQPEALSICRSYLQKETNTHRASSLNSRRIIIISNKSEGSLNLIITDAHVDSSSVLIKGVPETKGTTWSLDIPDDTNESSSDSDDFYTLNKFELMSPLPKEAPIEVISKIGIYKVDSCFRDPLSDEPVTEAIYIGHQSMPFIRTLTIHSNKLISSSQSQLSIG